MGRILVVEDDRVFGLELAGALGSAGHEVVVVTAASEAKTELWHWDFDLLLTDMVIRKGGKPVPDGGLGLISWVRQTVTANPGLKYLPIIAMSGEDTRKGMGFLLPTAGRLGADVLLQKPINMPELLRNIVSLIGLADAEHTAS